MSNNAFKLGSQTIGKDESIFMIAEIGINHNGDLQIAKRLIDAAFACGWDCVKFQKRTPEICVPEKQKGIMRDTPWGKISYLDYRNKVEFNKKSYDYIDKYCDEKPIMWTASAWDELSVDFLLSYDVPFIKVPSAKLNDINLLNKLAKSKVPLIVSTGMSSLEDIDRAVELLEKSPACNYALMHTNSTYPTPHEDLNLLAIKTLKERYRCVIGYSGHEYDLEPTVMAAVLGARVIERHVTLDHNMWGTDQSASLEVHAMDLLRKRLKDVHVVLGDGEKRITDKEKEISKKLRGEK